MLFIRPCDPEYGFQNIELGLFTFKCLGGRSLYCGGLCGLTAKCKIDRRCKRLISAKKLHEEAQHECFDIRPRSYSFECQNRQFGMTGQWTITCVSDSNAGVGIEVG